MDQKGLDLGDERDRTALIDGFVPSSDFFCHVTSRGLRTWCFKKRCLVSMGLNPSFVSLFLLCKVAWRAMGCMVFYFGLVPWQPNVTVRWLNRIHD